MEQLRLDNIGDDVRPKIEPFFKELLAAHADNIHSLHLTGSAVTEDYVPGTSDINSVVVLREMDLGFVEFLAPMGKSYSKKKVASPLIMTPAYIHDSLDVFPLEFLNIMLVHETVYGEEIFDLISVDPDDLRHQCEREIKVKLIGLRQGYISAMGNRASIMQELKASITGYIPLFRGIITLLGKTPPVLNRDVLDTLDEATDFDCHIFRRLLKAKEANEKPRIEELNEMFEQYYGATEELRRAVDAITA